MVVKIIVCVFSFFQKNSEFDSLIRLIMMHWPQIKVKEAKEQPQQHYEGKQAGEDFSAHFTSVP